MNTIELVEFLDGVDAVVKRYNNAMKDGRITLPESLTFIFDAGKIRTAAEGVHLVPAELLDLTEDELPRLIPIVSSILTSFGVTHRIQDITMDVVRGLMSATPHFVAGVNVIKKTLEVIKDRPPSAEAVQ